MVATTLSTPTWPIGIPLSKYSRPILADVGIPPSIGIFETYPFEVFSALPWTCRTHQIMGGTIPFLCD
jgi:hypothetical protein